MSCKTLLNICSTYTFLFPLGTKCAVQMPHWLSWAPTSNLNPSLNLKNGSLLTTRDREEECLASPPLLYNITYCLYLPLFVFTSLVTLFSFMHPNSTHVHPPPRPGHRANSDPSMVTFLFFLTIDAVKRVCYWGPVMAAHTGAKPSGAKLNGWAVRKPELWWWWPRLHEGSDGKI